MTTFTLSSPDIAAGASIDPSFEFDGFGCSGKNQSPVLCWSGAPVGTKSFAACLRPGRAHGLGLLWHWYVIDLPAGVELAANGRRPGRRQPAPGARQIRNDYGSYSWGGQRSPSIQAAPLHLHRACAVGGSH